MNKNFVLLTENCNTEFVYRPTKIFIEIIEPPPVPPSADLFLNSGADRKLSPKCASCKRICHMSYDIIKIVIRTHMCSLIREPCAKYPLPGIAPQTVSRISHVINDNMIHCWYSGK